MAGHPMTRFRETFLSICLSLGVTLVTLAALEVFLRIADFAELRDRLTEVSLAYDYDAELGWMPVPHSSGLVTSFRTTHYTHNSLGLRDEEFTPDARPVIMFLGDSFVWGLDSETDERFTEMLRPRLPDHKIVAAGVSGFGTDQEYLLLNRLWPKIKPAVVMLIFCTDNDRLDNSTNRRYFNYYKPYFASSPDGTLEAMGQPVPRSQLVYYKNNWLVRNLWLARLVTDVYVRVRYRAFSVPDPTERLVGKMRQFVEANGGKFLVGLQNHDEGLESYLAANRIPFVSFEGAAFYDNPKSWGAHWTADGAKVVADRIVSLFSANHIAASQKN